MCKTKRTHIHALMAWHSATANEKVKQKTKDQKHALSRRLLFMTNHYLLRYFVRSFMI